MKYLLCFCVIWLVCATAVLPAAIPSDANSVAAQTPEHSEVQNMNSNAKTLASGEKRIDAQVPGTLPVQEKSTGTSDFKINPSELADAEKNHQNPLHRKNDDPKAQDQLDENDESHLRNESPMHHQPAEPNSIPEHARQIQPQQIADASSMHRPDQPRVSAQPIPKPTTAANEVDWKTGLLNAVETSVNPNSGEKESKIQPQSVGASDQPAKDSAESKKPPQSTATTALSDDSTRNAEETATSFASPKEQLDDGKITSTQPKLAEPTPSTMVSNKDFLSSKPSQTAAVAPSSSGTETETNA